MTTTATYQSLNLQGKGRIKQGTVTSNISGEQVTHTVTVIRDEDRKSYRIMLKTGPKVARWAGSLAQVAVGRYTVMVADADSKITTTGYEERGTIDALVETVVHAFLANVRHAEQEAAKTPAQREAEEQDRIERARAVQQKRIEKAALDLIGLLNEVVPSTTVHYAVEEARSALGTLALKANTIKTVGA